MTGLNVDVSWSYGVGSTSRPSKTTDVGAMEEAGVNANVCVDMFMSSGKDDSSSTTDSSYEVMIWLGRFGPDTNPLGFDSGALKTRELYGVNL